MLLACVALLKQRKQLGPVCMLLFQEEDENKIQLKFVS